MTDPTTRRRFPDWHSHTTLAPSIFQLGLQFVLDRYFHSFIVGRFAVGEGGDVILGLRLKFFAIDHFHKGLPPPIRPEPHTTAPAFRRRMSTPSRSSAATASTSSLQALAKFMGVCSTRVVLTVLWYQSGRCAESWTPLECRGRQGTYYQEDRPRAARSCQFPELQ